jgi:hypothetical protein
LPAGIQGRLIPRNQLWVTQNIPEVEHAASWLNERISPGRSCHRKQQYRLSREEPPISFRPLSGTDIRPVYFAKAVSRDRFRYSANLDTAKYVVVGDIDQVWTLAQPNVNELVKKIRDDKWPIVWAGKYYVILANPKLQR